MSFVPPAAPAVPADAYGLPTLAPTSTPADFIHWWKNLILFAGNLKDGRNVEHGLLGLIMTPAQYATLPQAAAAPFFRYGVVPIQVIANDTAGTRDVQKQQAADQAIQNANITKQSWTEQSWHPSRSNVSIRSPPAPPTDTTASPFWPKSPISASHSALPSPHSSPNSGPT